MNRSPLLLVSLATSALFFGCDRSNPSETVGSNDISIAPRILAAGPLHGARVHLSLLHGHDTTSIVDTTYASGRHLVLGGVPLGDSFTVVVRGYDRNASGFPQITWNGIIRSKALSSNSPLLAVDIHADTAVLEPVDTASEPTFLTIPEGSWYTTNGSDPRVKDTGAGVHVSDGYTLPKSGIVVVASKSASAVPGDSVWSTLQRFNFDSLTSGMRTLLSGVWWEDDTTWSGHRCIYSDTFKNDGRFTEVQFDTLTLLPKAVDSGTWLVNGNKLRKTYTDDSYNDITLTPRGTNYSIAYPSGAYGLLTRNKPVASVDPYAVHFPLVGTWLQTYTYVYNTGTKENFYYIDTLRADSTFTSILVDSLKNPKGAKYSGSWSADSNHFIFKYSTYSDTSPMSVNPGGFRFDNSDGSYSVFKKVGDTTQTTPMDTLHPAALVGTWYEDDTSTSGRTIYVDTLKADGSYNLIELDTLTLAPIDSTYTTGSWQATSSSITFEVSGTDYAASLAARTGGYALRYSPTWHGILTKTKPTASPAAPTATPLVGVWYEDYRSNSNVRAIYLDTLRSDSTFSTWMLDTVTLLPTGLNDHGTWALHGTTLAFTYSNYSGDSCVIHPITGGYSTVYLSEGTSTLLKTKPTASDTTTHPVDSLHNATAVAALTGTWWFDTTVTTSSDDTVPFLVRINLKADGTAKREYFFTWLDSLNDTATLTWSAGTNTFKFVESGTQTLSPYTTAGDTVRFLDGSHEKWSKTRPVINDPALVGTWVDASSDTVQFKADGSVLWIYGGTDYTYSWSTDGKQVFLYIDDYTYPTYAYPYSKSSSAINLYGDDYTKR